MLEILADAPRAVGPHATSGVRETTRVELPAFCEEWRSPDNPKRAGGQFAPSFDHVFTLRPEVKGRILDLRDWRKTSQRGAR
jgi:hypothetical protein